MADNSILIRLDGLKLKYEEIGQKLTDPEVIADVKQFVQLTKEYKELEPIIETSDRFRTAIANLAEAKDVLANEKDEEFREIAREEIASPSALRVYVVVNGVASETRIFFRERFDISKQQVLTLLPDNQSINHGGVIRFSVYAQRNLRVVVTRRTPESEHTDTLVAMTHSLPHEVIIPTADFDPKTTNVEVVVWCDAQPIKRLNYRVIEPPSSAVRLVWYNAMGGVDSYLFLHSHRVEYKAVVTDVTVDGELSSTFRAGEVVRRLTTLPASNEMEALAQIVYSDRVYCEVEGELTPVRLITRSLSFDEHDAIHRLSIDIKANWRGGEL